MEKTTFAKKKSKQKDVAIIAIIVLVLLAIVVYETKPKAGKGPATATTSSIIQNQTKAVASTATDTSAYRNGTFAAIGSYPNPGGTSKLRVQVTLDNGVITDSSVTPQATDSKSLGFQKQFASAYRGLVVGKNINEVKLSRVSGSSLTSEGFNAAIQQIEDQAKV
jgi:uncharacterized protein with FMN-binding domain